MITSPTPATLSGRSLTTGAHTIKRPKSIWFDTGDDDQSPAVSQEPLHAAPVAAAAPTVVPEPSPAVDAAQDTSGVRLPIFDSVESEWFRRGTSVLDVARGRGLPRRRDGRRLAGGGADDERGTAAAGAEREPRPGLDQRAAAPAGGTGAVAGCRARQVAGGGARPADRLPAPWQGRPH